MREVYEACLRAAAACSRDRSDARDLVQNVFLSALEQGVPDLEAHERRAWLRGAVRRRAAFEARLADRRRRREARWGDAQAAFERRRPWRFSPEFLASLQPAVRALAALASAELNPAEIRALLGLSATAFRKRLSELRRFVREAGEAGSRVVTKGGNTYALGPGRAGLIQSLRRRPQAVLGSHDPDGHPLIFATRLPRFASK